MDEEKGKDKWKKVRPVVIKFGIDRLVVKYPHGQEQWDPLIMPFVAGAHCCLGTPENFDRDLA